MKSHKTGCPPERGYDLENCVVGTEKAAWFAFIAIGWQRYPLAQPSAAVKGLHMKKWEIIADRLSKAGWSWGCVPALDSEGRTIWIVDWHGYGRRFVVRSDEILTAFMELERAIHEFAVSLLSSDFHYSLKSPLLVGA